MEENVHVLLTLEQAKCLKKGTKINLLKVSGKDIVRKRDGSPLTYKVTSVKTWKRQPDKVEVVLHYGLRGYVHLREYHFVREGIEGSGIACLQEGG